MPKSKLRKNHKQKVAAWKQKNENITRRFNNKLREALAAQSNPNQDVKIKVSE